MQIEIIGRGSSKKIADVLSEMGIEKVLIVFGNQSFSACGAEAVFEDILRSFTVVSFSEFSPNPKFDEALIGVGKCRDAQPDVILAVGGGSVIDMAKTIAAFQTVPGHERDLVVGSYKPEKLDIPPLIAIPTTAGTGAEATHFAVLYLEGTKYSLALPELLPAVSVLDSTYLDNLPRHVAASSTFDALCQSIESFWAKGANRESREYSEKSLKILIELLPRAIIRPDASDNDNLLRAANLAGKAINITKTTAPHALSYRLTSAHGISHGHAAAMTLGAFFVFHESAIKGGEFDVASLRELEEISCRLYSILGVGSAGAAYTKWYQLMIDCGLDTKLSGVPFSESDDLLDIASSVNTERLGNHPLRLSTENLLEVMRRVP